MAGSSVSRTASACSPRTREQGTWCCATAPPSRILRDGSGSVFRSWLAFSGTVRVESVRQDLEVVAGNLWNRSAGRQGYAVRGRRCRRGRGDPRVARPGRPPGRAAGPPTAQRNFYGIGLTRGQNLTVINSDGSCTHFLECTLPAFQKEEFQLRLPADARLISASVNGTEIGAPRGR